MRKKKYYLILGKKSKWTYGAFPRTKEGRAAAILYRDRLKNERKEHFIVK